MLLVGAFAVCASGDCYVSREINRFSKSFLVANIKKCWFLETQDLVFAFRNSIHSRLEYSSGFVSSLQRSLSLTDLSRKIEGPLLAGCKLINNFFKNRSFQRYLVFDILTNPDRGTLAKKVTFWGKIYCQFHRLRTTLWRLNLPLLKR